MAELLTSEALVVATGDAFKSSRLDQMMRNFTASYKLYWLKGVFDEVIDGKTFASFEKLAARMIASAWYPVTYFRLNLGTNDILASAVLYAQERCGLSADAEMHDIVSTVLESGDPKLRAKVRGLYKYVSYRLIRPFYADKLSNARIDGKSIPDTLVNDLVTRFNREDTAGAPYRFSENNDGVEVGSEWARYFRDNRHVIQGWLDCKLISSYIVFATSRAVAALFSCRREYGIKNVHGAEGAGVCLLELGS